MSKDWTPIVLKELHRHGLVPGSDDTPATLREQLNDLYVEAIKALKAKLGAREFPLSEYADRVRALKEDYPLLGLPPDHWRR